ncbi:GntR family transcriptional regulator [Xanthobacter autotrophicus]|uniref:GntR family transcriptional regulator n=1 Tax=Xanthobacter autotrophicus TaxID=280 RepID=UPI001E5D9D94|nr:GntR family transcriptional regulator [Xanthobacter autotrophicus]UDQ90245.1 GntR family transcriptional regulator [Xanthobacter autotrophicus]
MARAFAEHIIYLRWPPGMRLIEEDLCAHFNVSRSPVRDAFQILEGEGLIVRAAWRGVRVAPMSVADLDEVYKCRVALEGLVAAEAARSANEGDLAMLSGLLAEMDAARAEGDVDVFFDRNVAFTRALHKAAANGTLARVVSGIEKQALRYRYLAHRNTHEIMDVVCAGDRKLLDAVAARKADLARREAVKLIRAAHQVIARVVAEVEQAEQSSARPRRAPSPA